MGKREREREREREWVRRLLKCQKCLDFDEEEFEWVPDMGVGDSELILLFYTAKGSMILFLKNLSSKLQEVKKINTSCSNTITRRIWGL